MPDYVPSNDDQFKAWLSNFMTVLGNHLAELGLDPADIVQLTGAQTLFGNALTNHHSMHATARSATAAKDGARDGVVALLRPLVRDINNSLQMTPDLRSLLGLPPREGGRTVMTVGEDVPDIYLETVPGQVIVHFGTTPANEQTNGKPSWARGCNIYRKKAGEEAFVMIAFDSASPYVDEVSGSAADYTYVVRYRGTRASNIGPQSTPATIAAGGELAA